MVAGGGVALVGIASSIHGALRKAGVDNSVHVGANVLYNCLDKPFRILMENAGLNADEWLPQMRKQPGCGIDVTKPEKGLIDLKKAGVIDPVLVTKQAVQNAVSIASTAATMGALVVDVPEPEAPAPSGMGMM